MCQIHEELAKKEVTPEDVLATFPDDVKIRAGALIKIVRIFLSFRFLREINF